MMSGLSDELLVPAAGLQGSELPRPSQCGSKLSWEQGYTGACLQVFARPNAQARSMAELYLLPDLENGGNNCTNVHGYKSSGHLAIRSTGLSGLACSDRQAFAEPRTALEVSCPCSGLLSEINPTVPSPMHDTTRFLQSMFPMNLDLGQASSWRCRRRSTACVVHVSCSKPSLMPQRHVVVIQRHNSSKE